MEKIPTYTFAFPVQYLRLGDLQLHLFERDTDAPEFHHIGINVDDFEDAYRRAKELGILEGETFFQSCTSCRTEACRCTSATRRGTSWRLDWPDVSTLDRVASRSSSASRTRCRRRRRRAERPSISIGRRREAAPFEYHAPATVDEAVELLARGNGTQVLAGGQSLVQLMKFRTAKPRALVDVNGVEGLDVIEERDGELHVGATRAPAAAARRRCSSTAGRCSARRPGTSAISRPAGAAPSAARSRSRRPGPS